MDHQLLFLENSGPCTHVPFEIQVYVATTMKTIQSNQTSFSSRFAVPHYI